MAGFQYSYDEENRLTAVRRVADNALLQEIKYDALGRRVETLDYVDPATGVISATALRTRHVYNGLKVIQEYTVTGSGGGQVSTLAREFVWGKRFPDQEVMIDYTAAGDVGAGTAEVLYYLHGALGSVVGLADANGDLVEKYEYDPYGRTYMTAPDGTARPVSAYGNPFAWTGQRFDPAVRLYHFWARSYSSALGRWLQRDPLGYVDGVGLYEYVAGQPLNFYDPYGLWWDTIADVCSLASNFYDWAKGVKTQVDFILDKPGVSYGECKEAGKECGEAAIGIAADTVGAIVPGLTGSGKAAKTVVGKLDDVGASTKAGKSWPTAREDYWKSRAKTAPDGEFSPSDLDRMREGKPPIHPETGSKKELHHIIPQRDGGGHTPDNLQEVWPWEHEEIDPFRYYRGPRPSEG